MSDTLCRIALYVAYRLQIAYCFVRRPRVRSAHVAVWWNGSVLVLRNSYRRPLCLPGGGCRRGEDPRAAAARELGEEAGLRLAPADLEPAGVLEHRELFTHDTAHFFEVHSAARPDVRIDRREVVWGEFVTPERVLAMRPIGLLRRYLLELAPRR